jgi:hypothetical protein
MNIQAYVTSLKNAARGQANELLKAQIHDYVSFVQQLVELGDIMSKRFLVVVPYDPLTDKKKGFFSRLGSVLSPSKVIRLKRSQFEERKRSLEKRLSYIETGLLSMNVPSLRLDTQGLIELYYGAYNPDKEQVQRLADINRLPVEDMGL